VDDDAEGVDLFRVDEHVELDELGGPVVAHLVVHRGVSPAERLEAVVEVEHDLAQGELPAELHPGRVHVVHSVIDAPAVLPELHDGPDVLGGGHDAGLDVGLLDPVDGGGIGEVGGILHHLHGAVGQVDVVLHGRDGGDEVEAELAFQPLLDDVHVEEAEEPAPESEAEGGGGLRFVMEAGIVQNQLLEGVAERFVLIGLRGVDPGEHHRGHVPVAGKKRRRAVGGVENGVPHPGIPHLAETRHEIAHVPRLERRGGSLPQLQVTDLLHVIHVLRVGSEDDPHPLPDGAVHHPDARDRPAVPVVVGVEDEGPERGLRRTRGGRNASHDRLQQLRDAGSLLGADREDLLGAGPDEVDDLLGPPFRFRAGQVDLVEDRDDLQSRVQREEEIAQGLGLDPLGGIHDQDGPLAGGEGARDFVGEVDVARRVDQVEGVLHPVLRGVAHPHRVELDGDATLPLQVHRVGELLAHEPLLHRAGDLDETVGQGRLAVVDVGDDAEIAGVLL